jgi:hypothetical protein
VRSLSPLPFGSVEPGGWLADRMGADLAGFVGHLDQLAPDLILDDDIYGVDRRTAGSQAPQLGALTDADHAHPEQFSWWNSETQSNWRDGWIRHVLLVGDAAQRERVRAYVDRMVSTADPDGYLGIYAADLRFEGAPPENGELWAQATLGRALLGYVEATSDRDQAQRVLAAVTRALTVTMAAYPEGGESPFRAGGYAGAAHGLMLVDVLDQAADLTGDESFRRYAAWLYTAYSASTVSEPDLQLGRLADAQAAFVGHGVHAYEHLRALVIACETQPEQPPLSDALQVALARLSRCLTPASGPIGDEWILGRHADASSTGYELCSTQELAASLLRLICATGDLDWADTLESTVLNAGLGAWHPDRSAVAYLQTDNAFTMTGNRPDAPPDPHQTRYRYSPLHREAAVCCVPNAGRLLPTFLRAAVLRQGADIVIALYGPMVATVTIAGVIVTVTQETTYPDELQVRLRVSTQRPVRFRLVMRRPRWATEVRVCRIPDEAGGPTEELDTSDGLDRVWHDDSLVVSLVAVPEMSTDASGEVFVSYGPRVFALTIPSETRATRSFDVAGLADLSVEPTSTDHEYLAMITDDPTLLTVVPQGVQAGFVDLRDPSATVVRRVLQPLGYSALRRLTFPPTAHPDGLLAN